ncbi:MAG: RNA methyltransferase [Acidobacteria bacterium]|nr:RNA methyltransferase [Acidobacteriota bacterium]
MAVAAMRLSSRSNPVLKTVRQVAEQARRAPPDLVLAEGLRVLEEAMRSPYTLEACVTSEQFGSTLREKELALQWKRSQVTRYSVPAALFRTLTAVSSPQGALALVRVPRRDLAAAAPGPVPLLVCACGLQDPGNLGTLLRSARAAGATLACTTRATVSARNPKVIRSSAGAFFHLPPVEDLSPEAITGYCRQHGVRLFRTAAGRGRPYWEVDLRVPCGILFGNESRGVDTTPWGSLPCIRIPMAPGCESLNVSTAAAVILFEASRQRARSRSPAATDEA